METDKYIRYKRVKSDTSEKDIKHMTFEIDKIMNDFVKNVNISKMNEMSYSTLIEKNINYGNEKCDVYKFSKNSKNNILKDMQTESLFKTLIAKININKNLICDYIYISKTPFEDETRLYVALHIKDQYPSDMDIEYNINKVYIIKK